MTQVVLTHTEFNDLKLKVPENVDKYFIIILSMVYVNDNNFQYNMEKY